MGKSCESIGGPSPSRSQEPRRTQGIHNTHECGKIFEHLHTGSWQEWTSRESIGGSSPQPSAVQHTSAPTQAHFTEVPLQIEQLGQERQSIGNISTFPSSQVVSARVTVLEGRQNLNLSPLYQLRNFAHGAQT